MQLFQLLVFIQSNLSDYSTIIFIKYVALAILTFYKLSKKLVRFTADAESNGHSVTTKSYFPISKWKMNKVIAYQSRIIGMIDTCMHVVHCMI